MVEASDLSAVLSGTVPHKDLTHEASRCDQIVVLLAELALHEEITEDLDMRDLDIAFLVDTMHSGNHIRRRSQKLVTLCIPVYRGHVCVLIVRLGPLYMGNLDMFKITEVLSTQIEESRSKPASCSGKEAVLWVELSEVYFLTVPI